MFKDSSYDAEENRRIIDQYDYLGNSASLRDYTGLIPWLPSNKAERESYEEVYRYQSPTVHMKPEHDYE